MNSLHQAAKCSTCVEAFVLDQEEFIRIAREFSDD
jgi:hypothetical protein